MKQFTATRIDRLTRRDFLKMTAALGISTAGMTLLEACGVKPAAPTASTEKLETTTIKIPLTPTLCHAPHYLAEDLLKSEGFTKVQHVEMTTGQIIQNLLSGNVNISLHFGAPSIVQIARGTTITFLGGVHVGCFKLFGSDQLRTIADLRGKTVAITELGGSDHVFLSTIAAYVGLDPNKDIKWSTHPVKEAKQLFAEGKLDGFLAFPPVAQELEAKKIGRVVLNSMMDDPWSQYFCCLATAHQDFVQNNPVATKRALRALLQASDICALQPQRAAQLMVDKGITENYDYALAAMQEIPFDRWRGYDPADTVRFYTLHLRDVGMITASPDEIIRQGTDWRFLNEIKKELKG